MHFMRYCTGRTEIYLIFSLPIKKHFYIEQKSRPGYIQEKNLLFEASIEIFK